MTVTVASSHDPSIARLRAGAVPPVSYRHLVRMTDDTGLFEHARGPLPKRWHGYCVDDVARGLAVVSREPQPDAGLLRLAEIYLAFLMHAQGDGGAFRNRLGFDRAWKDEPQTADCWGRALWGLGTAAARGGAPWLRAEARHRWTLGSRLRSPHVHAMAFAALGAAELLAVEPADVPARALLADAAELIGRPRRGTDWPWPAPRLTYASAALPEVLIAAGHAFGDDALLDDGLELLGWLLDLQTRDGRLSLVPVGGWTAGQTRSGFDQQPIEAAALADACVRARVVTGDPDWLQGLGLAVRWFVGDNDCGVRMIDSLSGGGYDGLCRDGRNPNQGAESTLALVSVMQHAAQWAVG